MIDLHDIRYLRIATPNLEQAVEFATRIVGLATNVQFLRRVLASDSFATAKLDTALIQRESAVLFKQDLVGVQMAAAAVVADALQAEAAMQDADPFSRRDGFPVGGLLSLTRTRPRTQGQTRHLDA